MECSIQQVNATERIFDSETTLHQLFEARAARNPGKDAVIFEGESMTYAALNASANALAAHLRGMGLQREQMVGVLCERSFEMMIAILGILKAGGAYLPLSPYDPEERRRRILDDSGAGLLLVQEKLAGKVTSPVRPIVLDHWRKGPGLAENLPVVNKSTDLAYIIYTSGSTGMPKGVMIEHRSVVNRLSWMQEAYPIDCADTILQKTPYNFDVSVWELFWWFMYGARLCFLGPGQEKNPIALIDTIRREGVSVIHFVPSLLAIFLDYIRETGMTGALSSLRLVFSSGEALTPRSVEQFAELLNPGRDKQLINLYGPTEATVDVTHYDCSQGLVQGKVPIGKPINNTRMFIVREDGSLASTGEVGELLIGGVGVGRGYLNRVSLTTEKFISSPHDNGRRLYRTGDLARWLEDGNIEYLGRIDSQVKIRGIRIELDEISAAICGHPSIRDCIVSTKKYSESVIVIIAYYFADADLDSKELKRYLGLHLPDYMIPGRFIRLDHVPLNANGKLDRAALPA